MMEDHFEQWFIDRIKNMKFKETQTFSYANVYLVARLAWAEAAYQSNRAKEIEKAKPVYRSTIPTDEQITEAYNTR